MSKKDPNINEEPKLLTVIERIGLIYDLSKHCGLDDSFLKKIDDDLDLLASYLKTNKMQAFLIATMIPLNFHDRSIGARELITYFNCNPMKLMKYAPELEGLCKLGILKKLKTRKTRTSSISNDYVVSENVLEAISLGKDIELLGNDQFSDIYQILQSIFDLWQKVDDQELLAREALGELEDIFNTYQSVPLLQRIISFDLSFQDSFMFLILIWKTLIGLEMTNLERTTEGIFDHNSCRIKYIRTFLSGENELLIKDLAEIVENNFSNEIELKLTEEALAILEESGLKIYSTKNKKRSDVIKPEDIVFKELIYNNEELKQLSLLK